MRGFCLLVLAQATGSMAVSFMLVTLGFAVAHGYQGASNTRCGIAGMIWSNDSRDPIATSDLPVTFTMDSRIRALCCGFSSLEGSISNSPRQNASPTPRPIPS